jgi:EMC6
MAKPRSRPSAKAREAATEAAKAASGGKATNAAPEHKGFSPEEALDMMHWVRQGLGLSVGALTGALKLTGYRAITTFVATVVLLPNAYFATMLEVDESEVAQVGSLKTEGIISAFALFLLLWILIYTTFL